MTRNASSAHEPATSMRAVRPDRREALRRWLARPRGRVASWTKLAVAGILIAVLLSFVDWRESLDLLGDTQLPLALCASALLAVGIALSTLKWQLLLAAHEIRLSLLHLLKYYWIGFFFSIFRRRTLEEMSSA